VFVNPIDPLWDADIWVPPVRPPAPPPPQELTVVRSGDDGCGP
jgi:hypothetical protein